MEVRTYTWADLQEDGTYISLHEDGVVIVKSSLDNRIVSRHNPSKSYQNALSAGGKKTQADRVENEVKQLLIALEIDENDERAKFLARSAVLGKSGDNLRSFLALVEMFQPEQVVNRPVQRIYMSDRAFKAYVNLMTEGGQMPQWMIAEDLPDGNWEDMNSNDIPVDGNEVIVEPDLFITSDQISTNGESE